MLDSFLGNGLEVYSKFLETLKQFKELDALPMETKIDTEEVTAQMMVENRGKWHRSCYFKFNSTKLLRAQRKRSLQSPMEQRSSK